jgi:hypothetical protein
MIAKSIIMLDVFRFQFLVYLFFRVPVKHGVIFGGDEKKSGGTGHGQLFLVLA